MLKPETVGFEPNDPARGIANQQIRRPVVIPIRDIESHARVSGGQTHKAFRGGWHLQRRRATNAGVAWMGSAAPVHDPIMTMKSRAARNPRARRPNE